MRKKFSGASWKVASDGVVEAADDTDCRHLFHVIKKTIQEFL